MENKKAKTQQEAFDLEEKYEGKPHGWIQWKGTDVCMDVHCKCGWHSHIDADFAYHVQCPHCKTIYSCSGHIELIEVEYVPDHGLVTDNTYDPDEEQD